MGTFVQWVHVTAAVVGVGGMGFLLVVLMPALGVLPVQERDALVQRVVRRFRWVSWAVISLLLASGVYSARQYSWEATWDGSWLFLTIKIVLAFAVFGISLALTVPLGFLERVRKRRKFWVGIAFGLGVAVIYISAYLRRG
ncbi:MAG: hypothetical protein LAP13_25555 [Acidobacteriia bacterium]|nr:hypothetical protein [Terriglobia bacterium]